MIQRSSMQGVGRHTYGGGGGSSSDEEGPSFGSSSGGGISADDSMIRDERRALVDLLADLRRSHCHAPLGITDQADRVYAFPSDRGWYRYIKIYIQWHTLSQVSLTLSGFQPTEVRRMVEMACTTQIQGLLFQGFIKQRRRACERTVDFDVVFNNRTSIGRNGSITTVRSGALQCKRGAHRVGDNGEEQQGSHHTSHSLLSNSFGPLVQARASQQLGHRGFSVCFPIVADNRTRFGEHPAHLGGMSGFV